MKSAFPESDELPFKNDRIHRALAAPRPDGLHRDIIVHFFQAKEINPDLELCGQ